MISLDQEIRKDKEDEHRQRRDRRDRHYRGRGEDGYNKRSHHHRSYENRSPPSSRHRTVLKISNLHYSITKEQLETICSAYGKVKMCKIDWDKMGRSKQTATVEFFTREDEGKALREMNEKEVEGQRLKVEMVNQPSFYPGKRHFINKPSYKYQGQRHFGR